MQVLDAPSPNHDARPDGVPPGQIMLHYTGMQSGEAAIARLRDPAARVSSHYVVEEDGRILRLVPEARRAWHAGASFWRGETVLNARSIGIEIVNPGHEWGYRPFPEPQIAAVAALCRDIMARHGIAARDILAHSDVAPTRKQDPGELFPWAALAAQGIGLWPQGVPGLDAAPVADGPARAAGLLAAIGYDIAAPDAALIAFQRRFRPERVDGAADAGTLRRLEAVAALLACGSPPYFAQWESPELVGAFIAGTADPAADPRWAAAGAESPAEYARWAEHLCGMACLRMVLAARGIAVTPFALMRQARDRGGYVETADGGIRGLIYAPAAAMLAEEFAIPAAVLTEVVAADIPGLIAMPGAGFIASVHPAIRAPAADPPHRGGHLVLVHGIAADGALVFHNPSGDTPASQRDARLPVTDFTRFFAGRGILIPG
ncbi:MAG TPA: N-acetylmuramoyl-L-alanine amidase [Roseomonas sp.]